MKISKYSFVFEAVIFTIALALIFGASRCAHADVITEIGMAYKLEGGQTSQLLWPSCRKAYVTPQYADVPRAPGLASCGGDNPAFIGWVLAWQSKELGPRKGIMVRAGAFHFSHWFDGGNYFNGGDDSELHGTWPAVTVTLNWSNMIRNRK